MITPKNLQKTKKYYIIWCNSYYETKLKDITTLYDMEQYIFSSRMGDLYLTHSSQSDKWTWQNPIIFDDRFEAILAIGVEMFRGRCVRRAPYSQEKHIDISMKYIPEKMI